VDLGVLERPAVDSCVESGDVIEIRGWIASTAAMTARARLEGGPWQMLQAGLPRGDLPPGPQGPLRGFAGHLHCHESPPSADTVPAIVEVEVQLEGQLHRSWRRRIRLEAGRVRVQRWLDGHAQATEVVPLPSLTWVVRGPEGEPLDRTIRSIAETCGPSTPWLAGTPDSHPPVATEWIGFLEAGDSLCRAGWQALCRALPSAADTSLVYADHLDPDGLPVLKPAAAPPYCHEPLFWDRGWLVRREVWEHRPAGRAFDDWWAARASAAAQAPWPLSQDGSTRRQRGGAPVVPVGGRVSVIIPTRLSDPALLEQLLQSLASEALGGDIELDTIVVLNNLRSADADRPDAGWRRAPVRCLRHEGRFNWSALNNAAARQSTGDWLLFLNDDIEAPRPGWLAAMLRTAHQPAVGIVGAVLRYPDGLVQHGGVWIGPDQRARHSFRHCSGLEPRVRPWLAIDRPQAAVTGACMLTSRRTFQALGGFDESLPVVCNDVDFCLRARVHGQLSVVCAGAELVHHEGLSREGIAEAADHHRFAKRWGPLLPQVAPERHPLLDATRDDWQLDPTAAWPPRPRAAA
jgi:GT2 family glycosyltransferase